ncbi:MAG: hypothetical protein AB7T49_19560 [Oligoflexales bacterium]
MKMIAYLLTASALLASCGTDKTSKTSSTGEDVTECLNNFAEAKQDKEYTADIEAALKNVEGMIVTNCRVGILADHTKIDPGNQISWFTEISYVYGPEADRTVMLRLAAQVTPEVKVFSLRRTEGTSDYVAKQLDEIIARSDIAKQEKAEHERLVSEGFKKTSVTARMHYSIDNSPMPNSVQEYDVEVRYDRADGFNVLRIYKVRELMAPRYPYSILGVERVTGGHL